MGLVGAAVRSGKGRQRCGLASPHGPQMKMTLSGVSLQSCVLRRRKSESVAMGFDLQPTLQGHLIGVRPLRPDDFHALFTAASDPLVWQQHPDSDRYKPEVFQKSDRK